MRGDFLLQALHLSLQGRHLLIVRRSRYLLTRVWHAPASDVVQLALNVRQGLHEPIALFFGPPPLIFCLLLDASAFLSSRYLGLDSLTLFDLRGANPCLHLLLTHPARRGALALSLSLAFPCNVVRRLLERGGRGSRRGGRGRIVTHRQDTLAVPLLLAQVRSHRDTTVGDLALSLLDLPLVHAPLAIPHVVHDPLVEVTRCRNLLRVGWRQLGHFWLRLLEVQVRPRQHAVMAHRQVVLVLIVGVPGRLEEPRPR